MTSQLHDAHIAVSYPTMEASVAVYQQVQAFLYRNRGKVDIAAFNFFELDDLSKGYFVCVLEESNL